MVAFSQMPHRYTLDTLSYAVSGVIASNSSNLVSLALATSVTGITVSGTQPAGTARYFAFQLNNQWGKLTSSGDFSAFPSNSADYETLSLYGNTAAELSALTDIPALVGQVFGIAIALYAEDPDNAVPTAGLSFSCLTSTQQLTTTQYSPLYRLSEGSQIVKVSPDVEALNGGAVSISAQATLDDGTVTPCMPLDALPGVRAKSVQLKGDYSVETIGESSAAINSVNVVYSDGKSLASGLTEGEIISQTQDWYMPIHHCRLTVEHTPLENSTLKAYVAFRNQITDIRGETLGIGSGARKVFQLSHTAGINYDSFKLYYDNVQIFDVFELNSEVGRVTCEAPEGVIVSCDYTYGWDFEEWQRMTLTSRYSLGSYDQSEFKFSMPENNKTMAAIKIVIGSTSGHIDDEILGTATGTARSYRLSHRIYDGNISLTAGNDAVSSKNWALLEDPRYISVAAPYGKTIKASYDWISEPPEIYKFMAVFAE